MIDDEKQSFIDAYRTALEQQRDESMQNLENTRRNAFQGIMGSANAAGMMYSNFPERAKMQYDTGTYMPTKNKIQTAYQTGLDKLRSNIVDWLNKVADTNADIASLNKQNRSGEDDPTANLPEGARILNEAGDYAYEDENGGTQYRNKKGENIRYGTAAKRAGITSNEDILKGAQDSLFDSNQYNDLTEIYRLAQENVENPVFFYNVGNDYVEPDYNYLSKEQNAFLGSLGLGIRQ